MRAIKWISFWFQQEAWSQLEILGQDPSAIKESSAAKRQLEEMEKQLQNTYIFIITYYFK